MPSSTAFRTASTGAKLLTPGPERKPVPPSPRYRILRPEDEAEVERLYQRLKTVGNLDQKNPQTRSSPCGAAGL